MRYIYVMNDESLKDKQDNITSSVMKHTNDLLLSLRVLFNKAKPITEKKFQNVVRRLEMFRDKNIGNHRLWIDSGGYSFITGKYTSADVTDMIHWYTRFMSDHHNCCDYLFSLDLPFSKKDPDYNHDKEKIKKINKKATFETLKVLNAHPTLQNKYVYVYQFLQKGIYSTWRDIYSDLDLGACVQRRAIGGIVGSRKVKITVPCPFIPIFFRCLVDFQNAQCTDQFALHVLGMSLLQDRFALLFLEELAKKYLDGHHIDITYDTSAYAQKGRLNHLWEPAFIPGNRIKYRYIKNFDDINTAPDIKGAPPESLDPLARIYDPSHIDEARKIFDQSHSKRMQKLKKDIEHKIMDEQKSTIKPPSAKLQYYEPFAVRSNLCKDEILLDSITGFNLVDRFISLESINEVRELATEFIVWASCCDFPEEKITEDPDTLARSALFDNVDLLWAIRINIIEVFDFSRWFTKNRDDENELDRQLVEFVEAFHDKDKKW